MASKASESAMQPRRKPIRALAAAIGVGLAWMALLPPPSAGASAVQYARWGVDCLTAILLALSAIEFVLATLSLVARTVRRALRWQTP